MTPMYRESYSVGVPDGKECKLLLNSDDVHFGGQGIEIPKQIIPTNEECDFKPYRITFNLAPLSAVVFQI